MTLLLILPLCLLGRLMAVLHAALFLMARKYLWPLLPFLSCPPAVELEGRQVYRNKHNVFKILGISVQLLNIDGLNCCCGEEQNLF